MSENVRKSLIKWDGVSINSVSKYYLGGGVNRGQNSHKYGDIKRIAAFWVYKRASCSKTDFRDIAWFLSKSYKLFFFGLRSNL